MRRHILTPMLVLLLLFGLASPVQAGEWVRGDVCKYRLPSGFRAQDVEALPNGAEIKRQLKQQTGLFGMNADADFDVYTRTLAGKQDATLAVMGIRLTGKNAPRMSQGQMNLDQMEQGMRAGMARMEEFFEEVGVRRVQIGGGLEGLEIMLSVFDEQMGGMATVRMVFVMDKKAMLMVLFQGRAENAATDAAAWEGLLASLKLDTRSKFLRLLMRYGPYLLGGLLLLFVFSWFRKGQTPAHVVTRFPSSDASTSSSGSGGAGLSRAADGLPVYADGFAEEAPPRPVISSPAAHGAPVGAAAPAPTGAGIGSRPPGGRTIPRSTPAPLPTGAPASQGAGAPHAQEPVATLDGGAPAPLGPPPVPGGAAPQARAPSPVLGRAGVPPQVPSGPPPLGGSAPPSAGDGSFGGAPPRVPGAPATLRRPDAMPRSNGPLPTAPRGMGTPGGAGNALPTNVARRAPPQVQPETPPAPAVGGLGALDAMGDDAAEPPPANAEHGDADGSTPKLKIQRNSDYR